MVRSLFQSLFHLITLSHFIIIFSSVILPVSSPIREFTILKVDAGKTLWVSSFILYSVISPVALSNKEKHPSTFEESKYFFKSLSVFALLTVQEEIILKDLINKNRQNLFINGKSGLVNFIIIWIHYVQPLRIRLHKNQFHIFLLKHL